MAVQLDFRHTNCAGGFVPNHCGIVQFNENVDVVLDNPEMIRKLKNIRHESVTQSTYSRPPLPKRTGTDHLPRSWTWSESGFARSSRATHPPLDKTETKETLSLDQAPHPTAAARTDRPDWKTQFPGNRDSGFTRAFNPNTVDPICLRSGTPLDLHPGAGTSSSLTHQDYLPYKPKSGQEPKELMTQPMRALRTVTGFNRPNQLVNNTANSWNDHAGLETSYTLDYPKKQSHCDATGKRIYGKGLKEFRISDNAVTTNLKFEGPATGFYISEAMERYTSPCFKAGSLAARHGYLPGAVAVVDNFNQTSGFVTGTNVNNPFFDPDPYGSARISSDRSEGPPLDPTRHNPWPRFLVAHRSMLKKNFRPNPGSEGPKTTTTTEFDVVQVQPGPIFCKEFPTLV